MVVGDVLLDILKVLEALEQSILENGVELVFDAGEHGVLFVDVKAERLKWGAPVKVVQVEKFEVVDDLGHTSLHLCLIQELLLLQRVDGLGHSFRISFEPWEATLKSVNKEDKKEQVSKHCWVFISLLKQLA